MTNGKAFLVLVFIMLLIAIIASGAMSGTDLTPNTSLSNSTTGGSQAVMGVRGVSTGICGSVYEVRSGDTLSGIAQKCGVTTKDLLSVNPSINNANLIHPGQKINLIYPMATPLPTQPPLPTAIPGGPQINGLRPGGKVLVAMGGFAPNAPLVVTLGRVGEEPRFQTEAQTDSAGKLDMRLDIPVTAVPGESWVVTVRTVSGPNIVVSAPPFTIEK